MLVEVKEEEEMKEEEEKEEGEVKYLIKAAKKMFSIKVLVNRRM